MSTARWILKAREALGGVTKISVSDVSPRLFRAAEGWPLRNWIQASLTAWSPRIP